MLLLIHGHGPNYLILLHAMRPLAEEQRMVIIAPSFGYGNWEAPGGVEAIERARKLCNERFLIDPQRVYLAGISQGGEGVSRAANDPPGEYAGLIYISAVMQMPTNCPYSLAKSFLSKPVLVIHGERDHHVRFHSIQPAIDEFESAKASVTKCFYADNNHFLFFARRHEILKRIADWMHANRTDTYKDVQS
jgi:predicted esterase